MNIIEQRFLRGPNLWSDVPCLLSVVTMDAGAPIAHPQAIAQLALDLQNQAGLNLCFCTAQAAEGNAQQCRIVFAYRIERVALDALQLALDITRGGVVDFSRRMEDLKSAVRAHAAQLRTAALIDTVVARGIPVLHVADQPGVLQLGWGRQQRRFSQAEQSDGIDSLAHAIADPDSESKGGRIPVIAVTGTNGKTTTTLMIAHIASQAGLGTGVTTTEGVFVAGKRVVEGDCAGFHSARRVLESSLVDIAVLETARGGILKRGLAFDACTVGVVLNVSGDHLGLDGIETIEQLARVKAVVARSASRAVVLNAEDQRCVAMASQLRDGVDVIYFSTVPDHAALQQHLAAGQRAAYLQDGALTLADGALRQRLATAHELPAALQGHAMHNVANALAAAAAAMAVGFSAEQIATGLRSFVSDAGQNPLRCNVYNIAGTTVIIDYAHNGAAWDALAAMARSMSGGRRLAVLTAPGDRRNADLYELGRSCGEGFDELYIYEADPRGRADGDTAAHIAVGARELAPAPTVHEVLPAGDAFNAALRQSRPGDILVFACGSMASAEAIITPYAAAQADDVVRASLMAR